MIRIEDEENNKPEDENTTVKKGESSSLIMLFRWAKMVLQTNFSHVWTIVRCVFFMHMFSDSVGVIKLVDVQDNQFVLSKGKDSTVPHEDHHLIEVTYFIKNQIF